MLARIGAAVAVVGFVGGFMWMQSQRIASLQEAKARLEQSVSEQKRLIQSERIARTVARAEAERFKARSDEYDALREALLEGNEDAPLPDWFVSYLDRLFAPRADGVPNAPR